MARQCLGGNSVPQAPPRQAPGNVDGLRKVRPQKSKQPQGPGQPVDLSFLSRGCGASRQAQPARIGQQMVEQQSVKRLPARPFEKIPAGGFDQIGHAHGRKTVGRAGSAEQTGEKRFFHFPGPGQFPGQQGFEHGQPSAGHSLLPAGGPEDRAVSLAEPATAAAVQLLTFSG